VKRELKCVVYRLSKILGLFWLARRLSARRLRILCYHGLSIDDEHLYRPGLFMRPSTIRSRLELLVRGGYPVLPLEDALARLKAGTLPACTVVITYDDGFYGNFLHGAALHNDPSLPATIYVTTYYVLKQVPIFRHAILYMFWKTKRREVSLFGLPGADGAASVCLADQAVAEEAQWRLIRDAETQLDEEERVALAREVGVRLGVDYDELARSRRLSLMTGPEIQALANLGWDIQLHTHRHQFPPVEEQVRREIDDNRAVLEPIVGRRCNHLCYPSGVFTTEQWPWLLACEIASATTCEPGLNSLDTPHLGLRRFLDAETVRPIEFEAELSGFTELLRRARSFLGRRQGVQAVPSNYGH
jgi:peptidoglycan/xylan/chitin deacetylase (PgdA/CDA1 family)